MGYDLRHIVNAKKYKVSDGDSLDSIAKSIGITWQELTKFNFNTDDPDEINRELRDTVGCRKKTKDGFNYIFTDKDDPGIIYLPADTPDKSYGHSTTHTINVSPPEEYTYKPADCYVNFRPKEGWEGEYGFDWLRDGDYDVKVAPNIKIEKYEKIVGKYERLVQPGCIGKLFFQKAKKEVIKDGNEYGTDDEFVEYPDLLAKLKKDEYKDNDPDNTVTYSDKSTEQNFTAYLSIYLNDSDTKPPRNAEITAQLFVKNAPEEIVFEFDAAGGDPPPVTITAVTPADLKKPSTGHTNIKIECTDELKTDLVINAKSVFRDIDGVTKRLTVGKLILMANSKAHRGEKNILLVTVTTPATTRRGTPRIAADPSMTEASQKVFIAKTLGQALVTPIFHTETLDLTTPLGADFDQFEVDPAMLGLIAYKENTGGYESISTYCYRKLKSKLKDADPGTENKYDGDRFIKAFYFKCAMGRIKTDGSYGGLNGYQTSDGDNNLFVVVTGTSIESTPVHEFLHALGLPHVFDGGVQKDSDVSGNAKFTYEAKRTENIMDYTHHRNRSTADHTYDKARIALWHWQWLIANGKTSREGSDDLAPVNL